VPFIIYADLECVLQKTESDMTDASSCAYQQHEVFSIGYYVQCSFDIVLSSYRFVTITIVSWFARQFQDLAHRVKNLVSANVLLMEVLSKQQREMYRNTTRHLYEKPFAPDDMRICDHCHLIGRYRGLAHANCNLNYKNSFYIPIIFHNLSSYDAHFI